MDHTYPVQKAYRKPGKSAPQASTIHSISYFHNPGGFPADSPDDGADSADEDDTKKPVEYAVWPSLCMAEQAFLATEPPGINF